MNKCGEATEVEDGRSDNGHLIRVPLVLYVLPCPWRAPEVLLATPEAGARRPWNINALHKPLAPDGRGIRVLEASETPWTLARRTSLLEYVAVDFLK